jgi:hypothetical protein
MASLRISSFAALPESAVVLRYGAAVILVAAALGTALLLRHHNLPHPFTSFSFAAIAITFWCAGRGPGLLALLTLLFGAQRFVRSGENPRVFFRILPCHLRNIWRGRELV